MHSREEWTTKNQWSEGEEAVCGVARRSQQTPKVSCIRYCREGKFGIFNLTIMHLTFNFTCYLSIKLEVWYWDWVSMQAKSWRIFLFWRPSFSLRHHILPAIQYTLLRTTMNLNLNLNHAEIKGFYIMTTGKRHAKNRRSIYLSLSMAWIKIRRIFHILCGWTSQHVTCGCCEPTCQGHSYMEDARMRLLIYTYGHTTSI